MGGREGRTSLSLILRRPRSLTASSLPLSPSPVWHTLWEVVFMTSEHLLYGKSQSQRAWEMKQGKVNKSISHGCFVSSIWFLAKRRFLSNVSIFYQKNAVLSHTNSIQCLFCAEFLESGDSIAVSGRSLWDLRGAHCKILDCGLQTSNEDLQYVCKK